MKRKLLIVCAFAGMGTLATAQTTMVKNDRGQIVTPEAGDWGLGMNAAPILNYIGDLFNGQATGNSVNPNSYISGNVFATNAIYGKYFMDENTAFRGSLGIGAGRSSTTSKYGSLNGDSLTNTLTRSGLPMFISFGIEKRKGHGRIQGYYGGELMVGVRGSVKETYDYAVAYDSTVADFLGAPLSAVDDFERIKSVSGGTQLMVGLRGFIGVEYFIAPKFSVAAEYGIGLSFVNISEQIAKSDIWLNGAAVEKSSILQGKSNRLGFATDNFGGAIRFMYHF